MPNTHNTSSNASSSCNAFIWTALLCVIGVWLVALIAAGLTAATVFSGLTPLEPSSEAFAGYPQPWQWRYLAGLVTEPAFRIADLTQFICLPLTFLLLLWQHRTGALCRTRVLDHVRTYLVLLASVLLMARWQSVQMAMTTLLETEREYVADGNWAGAQITQDAFLQYHGTASHFWEATTVVVAIAFVATAWAAAKRA